MGRPLGPPCTRKDMWLENRQIEHLEALAATSSLGKPPFTALVKQALEEFIRNQLDDAATRERVEHYLKSNRVVKLRKVQQ